MKKVLLVDDNVLFLKMLAQAFKKAGFITMQCESATEAIALLDKEVVHIILSDYEMPGMNGMEFRSYILNRPALKDIPFVFLTSNSNQDLMSQGLDLLAVDYVIKDTPFNVIVSKVTNLLETVKKQRELSELEIRKAALALNIKTIPANVPQLDEFKIDFWHRPYNEIPGGDFIDFIKMGDRYTFVILGDVMGKKWTAWFFTFTFLSYIRAAIRFGIWSEDYSTASILQKINQIVCEDEALKDILCSLSIIRIDSENSLVTYAGAGDLPLLSYNDESGKITSVQSSGLLLGLMPDTAYDEQTLNLAPNGQLFIFTDGMIDFNDDTSKKSDYHLFSSRMQTFMQQKTDFSELKKYFMQQIPQQVDDCSIINIKRTPHYD